MDWSAWLRLLMLLPFIMHGCGGSNDSEDDNEYYDQLWKVAEKSLSASMTEPEIAEALVRWIVNNSTNARWVPEDSEYPLPDGARGSEDALLPFHGLCEERSDLFQYLGTRAGLTVSVFAIYDLRHTCVQIFYEGDWHFYDVTYAGMFIKGTEVLSFSEIQADPESAIAGMVVFEQTGEVKDYFSNGLPVDNNIRMQAVYSAESLMKATHTEFLN